MTLKSATCELNIINVTHVTCVILYKLVGIYMYMFVSILGTATDEVCVCVCVFACVCMRVRVCVCVLSRAIDLTSVLVLPVSFAIL